MKVQKDLQKVLDAYISDVVAAYMIDKECGLPFDWRNEGYYNRLHDTIVAIHKEALEIAESLHSEICGDDS